MRAAGQALAANGVYVESAPRVSPKGTLHGAPETRCPVSNLQRVRAVDKN